MTHIQITTPFGRRPAKLSLVKGQMERADVKPGRAVDKWRVFRDACEAREKLGLQDRALAVLNALLSFYPEQDLAEDLAMVVFPSNAQLSIRAHGISGSTLRRSLAALVEAGLIERRDSPNGKRYAHRDRAGQVEAAFGFSLAPLLIRANELAQLAQTVADEARAFKRAKEALTICRRDVRKLISAALEEGADGNWSAMEDHYISIISRLPRRPTMLELADIRDEMELLREEVVNRLEMQLKSEKMHSNANQYEDHIQNSNTESTHEFELSGHDDLKAEAPRQETNKQRKPETYPLSMVLKACPQIADYGPGGAVGSWRDLMAAAVVVRSMLGVSPSAYQQACEAMGPEGAAITMACILERAEQIKSAGGYLSNLTAKAAVGEFSLGPALMALLRQNGEGEGRRHG
ncbi:plasmid replication protein RepC [Allorhizobium ampelinum]|uniref:plasmid replication protein RepC n=1 Tax=Allorhizobium ampelinum TaxID=3025782 RepID=UPI000B3FF21A|nr:plasmid replication protein RepC [Allorhizobium ampelinum]NTA25355.1 replication initiation protein RepC [Allorhizobium ampelinum]OVE97146.1 replication initiation protein RepC [Allorhizobium ampelinum]